MPRIRCHYADCVFLDDSFCSAAQVEFDPDTGCGTFSPIADAELADEIDEEDEWEEEMEEDEDEWLDEDEDEF